MKWLEQYYPESEKIDSVLTSLQDIKDKVVGNIGKMELGLYTNFLTLLSCLIN